MKKFIQRDEEDSPAGCAVEKSMYPEHILGCAVEKSMYPEHILGCAA